VNATTGRPVAVVTGGSAGVGRAAVIQFAAAGYDVAVLARGQAGIDGAVADVAEHGGAGLGIPTDVADMAAVDAALAQVESELGEIDVWVNNAFVGALAYFWDTAPEDFWRMTEVTYLGQVNGVRAALSVMRPRDRGVIINVSSSLAHRGIPLQAAYCGAKHAIKGFSDSVIAELASTGSAVRIGLVTLPGVNTPQFNWNQNAMSGHPMPVPPIYQPEVAARAIVELATHPRRNVWVGLPTAATILGNRLAPGVLDWYLGRTGVSSQQTDQQAPQLGANLHEPRDADTDRGAHGAFDDQAHDRDVVSLLSRTVGRTVGVAVGGALLTVGKLLDALP
jgi:NAD(P)-dependent dehydrogenase (short-subunit alcohol dehydrogenase family)